MSSARSGWRRWRVVGVLVAAGLDLAVLPRYPVLAGSLDAAGVGIGIWRTRSIRRAYRATRAEGFGRWESAGTALGELPAPLQILVLMDIGGWWALGRPLARRHRPAPGRLTLPYGLSERIFCSIFVPLSVIEVVVTGYFVHHTPVWLDWDLAGITGTWFLIGLGLQNTVFPHELSRDVLRIRHGALTCLDLPVTLIESVSSSALGFKEERIPPGSLAVSTKDGTNVCLRLRSPWHPAMPTDPAVSRVTGVDDAVSTVFFSVDDPKRTADAIRGVLAAHDAGARDEGASPLFGRQ
ncbi:MAG: hypothetical protein ACYCTI_01815 [Acidimicrobiales bacterium]